MKIDFQLTLYILYELIIIFGVSNAQTPMQFDNIYDRLLALPPYRLSVHKKGSDTGNGHFNLQQELDQYPFRELENRPENYSLNVSYPISHCAAKWRIHTVFLLLYTQHSKSTLKNSI